MRLSRCTLSFLNILADYATSAPASVFTVVKTEQHPTDLAGLRGARLVTASETETGHSWAEARVKQLTGRSPVTARFMRQDFFTFMPEFKLLIAGNHEQRTVFHSNSGLADGV